MVMFFAHPFFMDEKGSCLPIVVERNAESAIEAADLWKVVD